MCAVLLASVLAPLAVFTAAPPVAPLARNALYEGNSRFAAKLYAQLRAREGNLCFSPYSLSSALAMVSAGARGDTLNQLQSALDFPPQEQLHPGMRALRLDLASRQRKGLELSVANAYWAQEGFAISPVLNATLRAYYAAKMENVDFAGEPQVSRLMINRWVSLQTRRKVDGLFPEGSITPLTRLVLANGTYFKGDWARKFQAKNTQPAAFRTPVGKVTVHMMNEHEWFPYATTAASRVVELPYVGEELSLAVAIPQSGKKLADVEKELVEGKLAAVLAKKLPRQKLDLYLPRFKVSSSLELPAVMRKLGAVDVFGDRADLSGINGKKDLYLSALVQKAMLEVNEEGSEAAAGSGGGIAPRSRTEFTVNQPFVFLLRDRKTQTVLFMGRVVDPTKG
jgi:serpin B